MTGAAVAVLGFVTYSVLGWALEVGVRLVRTHRLGNPGFLAGPVVPIYAVGAFAIVLATDSWRASPLLVFAIGTVVATGIEFAAHLLLERLVGLVLWDYSGRFGNIRGRVCLSNSLGFGVGGLVVVYAVNPLLMGLVADMDQTLLVPVAGGLAVLMVTDWIHSVAAAAGVRAAIRELSGNLDEIIAHIENDLDELGRQVQSRVVAQRMLLLARARLALRRLDAGFPAARRRLGRGATGRPGDGPTTQSPDPRHGAAQRTRTGTGRPRP